MNEDVSGESSTPTAEALAPLDQAIANDDVSAYREVRLAERHGKELPTIAPKPADSAPAAPEQAASTDALPKPASEPGKPKKNAESRIQELLAENKRLKDAQFARPADVKPAESSPAKPNTREFERYKAMPDAPKLSEYEDYGDWVIDMGAFQNRKGLEEFSQKQQQESFARQTNDAYSKYDAKGAEKYPDFREVLMATAQAGRQFPPHVAKELLDHLEDYGTDLGYELGKARDDAALYERIADPVQFGRYVGEFLASHKARSKSPVPQTTRAPEPPVTLGQRPHDKTDALQGAVDSDDFIAFREAKFARARR